MSIRRACGASVIFLLVLCLTAHAEEPAKPIAIVVTANWAGSLFPCRCPINPEGGIARRVAFVRSLQAQYRTICLDAGGWVAGSIFDEYCGGKEEALARSKAMFDILYKLRCLDTVAFAPQDFTLGPPPTMMHEVALTRPTQQKGLSTIIRSGIHTFSVWPSEVTDGVYAGISGFKGVSPLEEAKDRVAYAIKSGATAIVMLSALDERATAQLVKAVPGITLAVVAGSAVSGRESYRVGKTIIAIPPSQGRAVGVWTATEGYRTVRMSLSLPEDAECVGMLKTAGYDSPGIANLPLDLYVMSRCPYGRAALSTVLTAVAKLPGGAANLRLFFIVSKDKEGKLRSTHGDEELEDDRRMLAVWLRKPEALADYVIKSAEENFDFAQWMTNAGLDPWKVKASLDCGEIDAELASHAVRCSVLGIAESPTLFISNTRYSAEYKTDRLLFEFCSRLKNASSIPACKELPRCYTDSDCFTPGMISVCDNPGTAKAACRTFKDAPVELFVIRAPGQIADPSDAALLSLSTLFPSMTVRDMAFNTVDAQEVIAASKAERLPIFAFGSGIEKAHNFHVIKSAATKIGKFWIATPDSIGANYFFKRAAVTGAVELFVSPLSERACAVIKASDALLKDGFARPRLRFICFEQDGKTVFAGGTPEAEEAARMVAALALDETKGWKYILARCETPRSTYWDDAASAAGLDPVALKTAARSDATAKSLADNAVCVRELYAGGEAFLLVNGREVVFLKDSFDYEIALWINSAERE